MNLVTQRHLSRMLPARRDRYPLDAGLSFRIRAFQRQVSHVVATFGGNLTTSLETGAFRSCGGAPDGSITRPVRGNVHDSPEVPNITVGLDRFNGECQSLPDPALLACDSTVAIRRFTGHTRDRGVCLQASRFRFSARSNSNCFEETSSFAQVNSVAHTGENWRPQSGSLPQREIHHPACARHSPRMMRDRQRPKQESSARPSMRRCKRSF
jgi:hypothetical protein